MSIAEEPVWTLGHRLRRSREEVGLDQESIGQRLGVSRGLVSKWERGKSEPTVHQARMWAQVTGVPFAWLVDVSATLDESHHSGVVSFEPVLAGV